MRASPLQAGSDVGYNTLGSLNGGELQISTYERQDPGIHSGVGGQVIKGIAPEGKYSFTTKCVSDGLQPYCEKQATGKRLSGAAKTSFTKDCQSGG